MTGRMKGNRGEREERLELPVSTVFSKQAEDQRVKGADSCRWRLPFLDVGAKWQSPGRRHKTDNVSPLFIWELSQRIMRIKPAAYCLSVQCADILDLHELLKGLRFACHVPHEKVVKTTFFYSASPSVTYCTAEPPTTPLISQGHRYRACTEIYTTASV